MRAATAYQGRTIMHCHILTHEDQGAMTWMNVIGGTLPPIFPGGQGYSELYALGGGGPTAPAAPSDLVATAVSTSGIDLTWSDNSNNETHFNLERSSDDGVTFSALDAELPTGTTSYRDTGLTAGTTYHYRVNAQNVAGTSDWSNIASATTLPDGGGPTLVTVGSINVTTVNAGKGLKRAQATVVVVDDLGAPVAGATVTGDFSGTFNEPGVSGPSTDGSGNTVLETTGTAKGGLSVTFCVTAISHPTLNDWSGSSCASL
jgi:hypothetical protein